MGRQPTRNGSLIRQREIVLNKLFSDLLYHIGLHVALGNIEPFSIDEEQKKIDFFYPEENASQQEVEKQQKAFHERERKKQIFSQNLKRIREENGYTRRYMAHLLEVHQGVYSPYENGRVFPSEPRLQRFAEILKVDPEDLLKPPKEPTEAEELLEAKALVAKVMNEKGGMNNETECEYRQSYRL